MKHVKVLLKVKQLRIILYRVAVMVLVAFIIAIAHLAWDIYFYSNNLTNVTADAAIVLGAAVWGEEPSPVFRERINHAINLYKSEAVQNIIFTGGQGNSSEQAEAIVARNYAIRRGVSATDILTESQSRTTWQNLYYAKQVAENHHLAKFLIVSDPLHMKRAMLMTQDLGINAYPSPTPTTRYRSLNNKFCFLVREIYFYLLHLVGVKL